MRRSKKVWNSPCVLLPAYSNNGGTAPLQDTKGERLLPLQTLCIKPSGSALFGDWIRFWPFVNKDNIIYYSYISVVERRAQQVADLILCSSNTWLRHCSECCSFLWKPGSNRQESPGSLAEINLSLNLLGEFSFLSWGAEVSCKMVVEGWPLKPSHEWLTRWEKEKPNNYLRKWNQNCVLVVISQKEGGKEEYSVQNVHHMSYLSY